MIDNKISNAHLELNDQLAEYLDGKSVAILGRGPSLSACDAKVIESYDVVARVHRPAPIEDWWPPPLVQPEWQSRVGSRTDILYSSMGTGERGRLEGCPELQHGTPGPGDPATVFSIGGARAMLEFMEATPMMRPAALVHEFSLTNSGCYSSVKRLAFAYEGCVPDNEPANAYFSIVQDRMEGR